MKTDEGVSANQRGRARAMRHAPTDAELRLWRLLRDRRLDGLKFRRQVPVGPYIVDFLCVGAKLIVEADGSQHAENVRDDVRDAYLLREGWHVVRFWNHELIQNQEGVLETILAHAGLLNGALSPSSGASRHLLPEGEGDRFFPPEGDQLSMNKDPEDHHA
jgi:very-short-patch-repair endonuclease